MFDHDDHDVKKNICIKLGGRLLVWITHVIWDPLPLHTAPYCRGQESKPSKPGVSQADLLGTAAGWEGVRTGAVRGILSCYPFKE